VRKIRVLIVDDSVVARRLLADALGNDPAVEVADTAATGRVALAKIPYCTPDAVTLDVDMPEMSGLETLAAIRKEHPHLPVIMVSNLTEHGAVVTLDALSLGATDYVTKPADVRNREGALKKIKDELLPKIKTFCRSSQAASLFTTPSAADGPVQVQALLSQTARVDVVAIGISTGGPNALAEILPPLPKDFPVPILIVQHMPPIFTKFLSDRLASKCQLAVSEAAPGDALEPGHVYIAPGDHHLAVEREEPEVRIRIHQEAPENSCRPSVDVMLRSVAKVYGSRAMAVIMTGMGQDGLKGCEQVKRDGGQVLAQDEASSVVWGMPGFVVRAGLADKVLPLGQIPMEILRRVKSGRAATAAGGGGGGATPA
jgi:two-component system, chemotaxis family, protein-glutamate methylesterase/glutaminase